MKVKVREAYVPRSNPKEVFKIIEDHLVKNINTMVYVENSIFKELDMNGHKYNVYNSNRMSNYDYEEWLEYTGNTAYDDPIYLAGFGENSENYMQIMDFESEKIDDYEFCFVRLEELLVIDWKKKEEEA